MSYKLKKELTGAEAAGAIVGILLGVVLVFFLQAWIVMLIIGALHATVWTSLPAYGYWASCLVTLVIRFIASFFRSSK